jgi:myo-inositol 2-dehydrogenase/D-chiro-inositol 1-dehydrogenase/scyllo-inositol 2-dehydrogenase (NAD+)
MTHGRVLAGVQGVNVVTVCDNDQAAAERVASAFGARAVTDLGAVLHDPGVEAVVITTPTPSHVALVEAAVRSSKAVFVEKPVADTLAAADRVVAAVARAGVPCQVGFQRRYDPAYLEAKRRLEAGELGRLEGFQGVGRDPAPPELKFLTSSGGLMVDMGIHDLDSARFFLGEVREVYCTGGALSRPELAAHGLFDTAVATLRFAGGAVGTLEVALHTGYGYDIRAEVWGEAGRLRIEKTQQRFLRYFGGDGVRHDYPRNFEERFAEAYAAEMRAFAENVLTGAPVGPGPEDARESLRLALAAQRSLETGRVVRVQDYSEEV